MKARGGRFTTHFVGLYRTLDGADHDPFGPVALAVREGRKYAFEGVVEAPRGFSFFPLVVSALCAVLLARLAWESPRLLVPLSFVVLVMTLPAALARRRMQRLLRSGDVQRILAAWTPSFARMMHPETMTPLLVATAYAACGFVDAARRALERAARGPAWEAAIEQRLVLEAMLDTFEGERDASVEKALALNHLPLPAVGLFTRRKILRLRRGVLALARAFSHTALAADRDALRRAAKSSPIVHWPMRYAEAIVAVDEGKPSRAVGLLHDAPAWPTDSAFASFQAELDAVLGPAGRPA